MRRAQTRWWIVFVLLASWHVPAFAAIEVGLHLAGGDHHSHEQALEIALAAAHGHHHQLSDADHDHPAIRVAVPTASPDLSELAVAPRTVAPALDPSRAARGELPFRVGPPKFFYQHCALLL
jgi:hypothetical protein